MKTKIPQLILAGLLLCFVATGSVQAAIVLIDFGNASGTPGGYTEAAIIGANGDGVTTGDVALGATGWTINVTETGALNGGNAGAGANYGTVIGDYPGELSGFEVTALQDGIFANANGINGNSQLTVAISGLVDGYDYDLLFYGARGNSVTSDEQGADWDITKGIGGGATINTDITDNSTDVVDWDGIRSVGGEIVFTITSVGTSFEREISLNFGQIIETVPEPSSTALLGLGGLALALRRRRG
jgi:hypothetical protein